MSTQKLQIISIVMWAGVALLILGALLSYPLYAPYLPPLFGAKATPVGAPSVAPLPTQAPARQRAFKARG